MGKQRSRRKLHLPSKVKTNPSTEPTEIPTESAPITLTSPDNIFAGINIDINSLTRKLSDDTVSIKSYKSLKSAFGEKALKKKDKLKLRRELLLKKIDVVNQLKKERKLRRRRQKNTIIGDTNPLRDALPSLDSLLKSNSKDSKQPVISTNVRGIEKASKRKKDFVKQVGIFKEVLKNKDFKKDPLCAINNHVKAMVQSGSLK